MGVGDEILAAGQAQQLYEATGLPSGIYDRHRKLRAHPIWDGNPAIVQPGDARGHHIVINGPHCRPYLKSITEERGWEFNYDFHARDHIARIYLTEDEEQFGALLRAKVGRYVLIDPWSKHTNLRWPIEHWTALVARNRNITWVQHLWSKDAPRIAGCHYVETPSFRIACGVLASADLYVRCESGMCHAAAALDIPNVAIWGGCMDWDVLGGYPKQIGVGVSDDVCGSWRACKHCEQTMHGITVTNVENAIGAVLFGLR